MKKLLLLLSTSCLAQMSSTQKADVPVSNFVFNAGFENGLQGWTASGGSLATTSSSLSGSMSATWDSNSASQTLRSKSVSLPLSLYGRPLEFSCNIKVASGTGTHTIGTWDGTTYANSVTIVSSTTVARTRGLIMSAPTTGTLAIQITSVNANEPSVTIDDCEIRELRTPILLGSLSYAATTSCEWQTTSTTIAAFSADTDCPSPSVLGFATAPGTKIPGVVFAKIPPGDVQVVVSGVFSRRSSNTTTMRFDVYDGSTGSGGGTIYNGSAVQVDQFTSIVGRFRYTALQTNVTFQVRGLAETTGTAAIKNDTSTYANELRIDAYWFPL